MRYTSPRFAMPTDGKSGPGPPRTNSRSTRGVMLLPCQSPVAGSGVAVAFGLATAPPLGLPEALPPPGIGAGALEPPFQRAVNGRKVSRAVVPNFWLGSIYEFSKYSFQLTIMITGAPLEIAPFQLAIRNWLSVP